MFVSKKMYRAMKDNIAELKTELDALKASRARSNENLKLGTAASAKARRKKVACVDWSKPIEAYHPDGRVKKVKYSGQSLGGYFVVCPPLDKTHDCFEENGLHMCPHAVEWRIRNVA